MLTPAADPPTTPQAAPQGSATLAIYHPGEDGALARSDANLGVGAPDAALLRLWLHGRPATTVDAYRRDVARCLGYTGKPLGLLTLADLQDFADSLAGMAPSSQSRTLSSVKSLLSFGHRLGLLPVNAGAALLLPAQKDALAERILEEPDVQRMLALERQPRNRALLAVLYAGGLRVSEACSLCWRDVKSRGKECQITVFGKGGKTRAVLLSAGVWKLLRPLKGKDEEPVFRSRQQDGRAIDTETARRIVRLAARRASITLDVSPHWLRHAHASHALDRGAPIHLVQQTLGHASLGTTSRYTHARPNESSGKYLAV
jgi:integrase/recombinase XerD